MDENGDPAFALRGYGGQAESGSRVESIPTRLRRLWRRHCGQVVNRSRRRSRPPEGLKTGRKPGYGQHPTSEMIRQENVLSALTTVEDDWRRYEPCK